MKKKIHKIEGTYYPIVYVRGYARTHSEREEVFNDTYYGFSATSVEQRQGPPDKNKGTYLQADVFEGQLIRFLKIRDYAYADAMNEGLFTFNDNPSRSIWISRFYDQDYINGKMRSIEEHADELYELITEIIPERLLECGVSKESIDQNYKVILIAHSMGGLVCRALIQNLLPAKGKDPKKIIHRLVTMGSPHKGIDLGNIPDKVEDILTSTLSPDSTIFREERMRQYLKLGEKGGNAKRGYKYDLHSLGVSDFPIKRCLCIVGSDHKSYIAARHLTGSFSDGLVRQDNAYMVAGPKPKVKDYPEQQVCFYANVHRAHSGYRGIVNSYESFENIQRFLFGNIMAKIFLQDLVFHTKSKTKDKVESYYDFEFKLSIRGTNSYLHRREQEPCENSMRHYAANINKKTKLHLHTGFLNSKLKPGTSTHSHFVISFKVVEYHVKKSWLWDREYPGRTIYSETAEIRLKDINEDHEADLLEYRWMSDVTDWEGKDGWQSAQEVADGYLIPLRQANTMEGNFFISASKWPDAALTMD